MRRHLSALRDDLFDAQAEAEAEAGAEARAGAETGAGAEAEARTGAPQALLDTQAQAHAQAQAQAQAQPEAGGLRVPAATATDPPHPSSKRRRFARAFLGASDGACDFLSRCLTFDPADRITARAALELDYFRLPYAGSDGPYVTSVEGPDCGNGAGSGGSGRSGGSCGGDGSPGLPPHWARQVRLCPAWKCHRQRRAAHFQARQPPPLGPPGGE